MSEAVSELPVDTVEKQAEPGFVIPLVLVRHTEGAAVHAIPDGGIYLGVLCFLDTTITLGPVPIPSAPVKTFALMVQLQGYDGQDPPVTCSVKVNYFGRDGVIRSRVTPPVTADGVLPIPIDGDSVDPGAIFASSVQVVLMDEVLPGQEVEVPFGVHESRKRPVLVRGAWLEFPASGREGVQGG